MVAMCSENQPRWLRLQTINKQTILRDNTIPEVRLMPDVQHMWTALVRRLYLRGHVLQLSTTQPAVVPLTRKNPMIYGDILGDATVKQAPFVHDMVN